jgi:hypothetical protein
MQRVLKECEACRGKKVLPVVVTDYANFTHDPTSTVDLVKLVPCQACEGKGMKFVEVE